MDAPGAADTSTAIDASVARVPWTSPHKIVDGNASFWCESPTLTPDLLTMYASCGPYGSEIFDIVRFHRTATGDPWPAPAPVPELKSTTPSTGPSIAPDERTIWFSTVAPSSNNTDLFVSTRASTNDPWPVPVVVPELSSPSSEFSVKVIPSGLAATWEVTDANNLSSLPFSSSRADVQSAWGAPAQLSELGSFGPVYDPTMTADQLALYFVERSDCANGFCLFVATRARTNTAFGDPVPIEEINALGPIRHPWISPDGHTLYFDVWQSATDHLSGSWMYEATR